MSRQKGVPKAVQGAWLTTEDCKLLKDEATKRGQKSSTALASSILADWCSRLRARATKSKSH